MIGGDIAKARRYLLAVAEDAELVGYHKSGTPCHAAKRKCPKGGCVGHDGDDDFDVSVVRLICRKIKNPPEVNKGMLNQQSMISEILDFGIKECAIMFGAHTNETGAVYVKNKDVGEFLVGKRGLRHGLRPYSSIMLGQIRDADKYNAYVMTVLGSVLSKAFLLRIDPKDESGRNHDSIVMMSACRDGNLLIPVLIRLNKTDSEISKIVVLKSINTKRQDRADVFDLGFEAPDDPAFSRHSMVPIEDEEIIPRLVSLCQ